MPRQAIKWFTSWPPLPAASIAAMFLSAAAFMSMIFTIAMAPAQAQETGTAMSVPEIAACLCLEPLLEAGRADIAAKRAVLDERREQLAALETEIERKRTNLDPADLVGQAVLKNLINQSAQLRGLIGGQAQPALNRAVAAYNELAGSYNRDCTVRSRYAYDVEQARKNLVCEMP